MKLFFPTIKPKFRAWFFIKHGGTYKLKKKKRFNPLNKTFKYKGKAYSPELDNPTFDNGNKSYFFFEIGNSTQIATQEFSSSEQDTEIKDLLYVNEVMYQGFKAIKEKGLVINWIHLVLGMLSALAIGWIIGNYIPIGVLP